jgi:hypothetical protein
MKDVQATEEASKENIQYRYFKTRDFFTFSIFMGYFSPPTCGAGSSEQNQCGFMRIWNPTLLEREWLI